MVLAVILLLSFGLRLVNINQSLWLDEAVQALTAQGSFWGIFAELKGDFHPPFYHLLIWLWVRIFGSSEIALRIPSVLFGVGTVYLIYKIINELIINELTNSRKIKNIGLTTALLLATSQFHIYYSQEARMYALAGFLATLSMSFFMKINKLTKLRINELVILYFLATVLLVYTDYYGFLVIFGQILGGLVIFRKDLRGWGKLFFPIWLGVLVLYLPWLPFLGEQIKTGLVATRNLPGWGGLVNLNFWKALPLTFLKFGLGRITMFDKKIYALVAVGVLGLIGTVGIWGGYKNWKRHIFYKLILLWFLLPVVGAWIISLFIPNYQPFRLILVLPAFWLLLGAGISPLENKKLRLAVMIIFLGINLGATVIYWTNPYFQREDWRGVANYLRKENLPIVISSSTFNWPLVYYGAGEGVVGVVNEVREIREEDKMGLIGKIRQIEKIAYTPYLADIYDKERKVPRWLKEAGFDKIGEISFNQTPLFVYENRD